MYVSTSYESPAVIKAKSFLEFPPGWHYGEGSPPDIVTVRRAVKLIEQASMAVFRTNVFPGIDGQIQVSVYCSPDYLEFVIEPDGKTTFVHERNDEEIAYKEDLDFESAVDEFNRFRKEKWRSTLEQSTHSTTTPIEKDSLVWRFSRHPEDERASRFLIWDAQNEMAAARVATSGSSINVSLATLQSSGEYPSINYPTVGSLTPMRAQRETFVTET